MTAKAPANKPATQQAMQTIAIVVGFAAAVNVAFFFLSGSYFEDRAQRFGVHELEAIGAARMAFGVLSIAVVAASIFAALAPRWIGHGLALLAGLTAQIAAFPALSRGYPEVVGVTLLIVGLMFELVVWRSLAMSRAAWSFLIALCATFGVIMMFAAPKLRTLFGVSMWTAMIVPGLLAVATIALTMLRDDYRDERRAGR